MVTMLTIDSKFILLSSLRYSNRSPRLQSWNLTAKVKVHRPISFNLFNVKSSYCLPQVSLRCPELIFTKTVSERCPPSFSFLSKNEHLSRILSAVQSNSNPFVIVYSAILNLGQLLIWLLGAFIHPKIDGWFNLRLYFTCSPLYSVLVLPTLLPTCIRVFTLRCAWTCYIGVDAEVRRDV